MCAVFLGAVLLALVFFAADLCRTCLAGGQADSDVHANKTPAVQKNQRDKLRNMVRAALFWRDMVAPLSTDFLFCKALRKLLSNFLLHSLLSRFIQVNLRLVTVPLQQMQQVCSVD